jgi:hypothetical protein
MNDDRTIAEEIAGGLAGSQFEETSGYPDPRR